MPFLALFSASAIGSKLEKIALYALAVFTICTVCYFAGVFHERRSAETLQLKTEIATLKQDKKIADDAHRIESTQTEQLSDAVAADQKVIDDYRDKFAVKTSAKISLGIVDPQKCPVADNGADDDFINKLRKLERN